MVKQYREIKARHKDAILFFRLGDFYEMFNADAELASRELDLTLTGRGEGENRMPMCGIPYHAAESYIGKLIEKGYKVAICEQVEDPALAKGLVKRDVIKIYTPGTLLESSMLSDRRNNYLLVASKTALAYIDVSTGEFRTTEAEDEQELKAEIDRIAPVEVLYSDSPVQAIMDYLKETRKTSLGHIGKPVRYLIGNFMYLDQQTRKNLELVETIRDRSLKGSLLWVLDQCRTNMGSRLLRSWILAPLLEKKEIDKRLDAVEELSKNTMLRAELAEELKNIYDIERLTARIASASANARDLIALKNSLQRLPKIAKALEVCKSEDLEPRLLVAGSNNEIVKIISDSITEDPPLILSDGGLLKDGFNAELDELKAAARGGKSWITELENKERVRTGIKSLKVGFTKVFGYYIEISNSNLSSVPQDYIRKQTLVNGERFITPELKEKESLILNADESMKKLEYQLFCQVRDQVAKYTKDLQAIAAFLARLDVFYSLAEVAVTNNYCRPTFGNVGTGLVPVRGQPRGLSLHLKGSRHPVVEKMLGEHNFTPNNVEMDEDSRFLMITGPNMAGKSTYMRQVALISLMAQIGSFVPAREAKLGIIDRIFTRIGAMDDIFSGQSTFMLEMTETANILNNATEDSLIILDEIGRGTATFDGMSIAAAVAEYIHNKIKAKTLFATHYHEITQLADKLEGMKNLNVLVKEEKDHITFLHKIGEGAADKSYGIAVAKLAGLPAEVVKRAKEVYEKLEMVESDLSQVKKIKKTSKTTTRSSESQIGLFG